MPNSFFREKKSKLLLSVLLLSFYSNTWAAPSKPQKEHPIKPEQVVHQHVHKTPKQTPKNYLSTRLDQINAAITPKPPKVVGYLQVDYAHYVSDHTRLGDGEIIRRAFLGVVGEVTPNWGYTLIVDFGRGVVRLKDAWLIYTGFRPTTIRIGHMKEPMSLEHLIGDVNLTFLERALPTLAFFPDRRIGIDVDTYGQFGDFHYYTASIGLFGVDAAHVKVREEDDSWGGSARLTLALQPCLEEVVHLGLWGTVRKPDSNKNVIFLSKPESDITNVTFVNTGIIHDVRYYETFGGELAGVYGPFSLQGEYFGTHMHRQPRFVRKRRIRNSNLYFKGWYAFASVILTGESREYIREKAIFGGVKPTHDCGAWEVAVRYSNLNLNSRPIIGGKENNITVGLNWYVNNYVEFMGNYIKVYAKKGRLRNQPSIYTVRAQIAFL